jgi:hypothetical protein
MPCVTFWRQSSDRVDLDHCSKMIHPPFPGPDVSQLSRYAAQERARPLGMAVIEANRNPSEGGAGASLGSADVFGRGRNATMNNVYGDRSFLTLASRRPGCSCPCKPPRAARAWLSGGSKEGSTGPIGTRCPSFKPLPPPNGAEHPRAPSRAAARALLRVFETRSWEFLGIPGPKGGSIYEKWRTPRPRPSGRSRGGTQPTSNQTSYSQSYSQGQPTRRRSHPGFAGALWVRSNVPA